MMDQPSLAELIKAVRDFLENKALPELKGHTAFHGGFAATARAIPPRQLEQGAAADEAELKRLQVLLGRDGSLEELNRALGRAIQEGTLDIGSLYIRQHLAATNP